MVFDLFLPTTYHSSVLSERPLSFILRPVTENWPQIVVTSSAIDKMFEIFGPIFEQNANVNFEPIFEQNVGNFNN